MAYQMYRSTTLGVALQETLDELIRDELLSNQLALRVLATFDKCINNALSTRSKNKTNFKVRRFFERIYKIEISSFSKGTFRVVRKSEFLRKVEKHCIFFKNPFFGIA